MSNRRVPIWTQVTQTECGLSCCLAILEYYGRFEQLVRVREDIEAGRDGLSARQLKTFLESRDMNVKVYGAGGVEALRMFDEPVILYWDNYHFVVLDKIRGDVAYLMDPAVGRRRITVSELEEHFSRVVIAPLPETDFAKIERPRFHEWRQRGLRWGAPKARITLVIVLSLISYAFVAALPMLTAAIIDAHLRAHQQRLGAIATAVLAGAAVFWVIGLVRSLVLTRVVRIMGRDLMTSLFHHMLKLPLQFFSMRTPGELMYRLASTNVIRDAISTNIVQGVLDGGLVAVVLVCIVVMSPMMGLVALVLLALMIAFLIATRSRYTDCLDAEIAALTEAQTVQYDAVSSMTLIKMGGYADDFQRRWERQYERSLLAMERRMRMQTGWIGSTVTTLQLFSPLLLLVAGVGVAATTSISLGSMVAIHGLTAVLFSLTESAFRTYSDYLQVSRYLIRLTDITETDPEDQGGGITTLAGTSLEVRNVSFRYTRQSPDVLQDISLSAPAGSTIALVGQSGSGKSTLGLVLCGLYPPSSGQVLVGGIPLTDYDLEAVRPQMGYVPQDVTLHNGTVLENLSLGNDLDDESIMSFCRGLGFLDFIDELPMGYRTMVSDLGANFSGGQKQRMAIARALVGRPRVIVLDEATSALDTINEAEVGRVLADMGCTVVLLAHRLETIRSADQIIVLSEGRIVEQGDHETLLRNSGHYAELYAVGEEVR